MENCMKDEGNSGSDPSVRWILRGMVTSGHSADHSRIKSPRGQRASFTPEDESENEYGLLRGGSKVTLEDQVLLQVVSL